MGVRRRHIQLDNAHTSDAASVLNGNFNLYSRVGLLKRGDLLLEGGEGQTVSKRILNMLIVVDETFIGGGLIELVTNVDAVGVVYEGDGSFIRRVSLGDRGAKLSGGAVRVREEAKVVERRGRGQILDEGVNGLSGRVHGTVQDFAKGGHTGGTGAGGVQNGLDLGVIVNPAKLHGVVRVDDNDNLLEVLADKVN